MELIMYGGIPKSTALKIVIQKGKEYSRMEKDRMRRLENCINKNEEKFLLSQLTEIRSLLTDCRAEYLTIKNSS